MTQEDFEDDDMFIRFFESHTGHKVSRESYEIGYKGHEDIEVVCESEGWVVVRLADSYWPEKPYHDSTDWKKALLTLKEMPDDLHSPL